MLLVNATAGASAIHGIGLIAREFIPRGTRIWEYRQGFDLILTPREVESLSAVARDQVLWYAFYDQTRSAYVLSGDDDRFTNHADDPNTADDGAFTVARRDILPGEELTADYRPWEPAAAGGAVRPDVRSG